MEKFNQKKAKPYCMHCEHTGLVHNQGAYLTGEAPISVCPKCIGPLCKCGGKEPYFYTDGTHIIECPCRELRLRILKVNALYQKSGIDKKYQWRFINEFNSITAQAQNAKTAAYDICKKFPHVDRGLFLWGNPGTGKTMLSTIILTELITRHALEGRFLKISRSFFDRIRATFNEASDQHGMGNAIEREIANVDVLVIDDFGVQRNTPWEQETLYNLIDTRYEGEKFTIITSNHDPVKQFGELFEGRILSRIREMCRIMELTGPDQRAQ